MSEPSTEVFERYLDELREIQKRLDAEKALGGGRYPSGTLGLCQELEAIVREALGQER